MAKQRNTDRKRRIQAALKDMASPIVLEELRWKVMRQELQEEVPPRTELTKADMVSFNRSLRTFVKELTPGLSIHKVEDEWTAGLLARVAVFRLKDLSQIDQFSACKTVSFHFWTNARTADVWEEPSDGEVEVHRPELMPPDAPESLPTNYKEWSRWPRGGDERRRELERMGPKYLKKPLVCVKLCLRETEEPETQDVLAIIRIPVGQPLTVIGPDPLDLSAVSWPTREIFRRFRRVTRKVRAKERIV